MLSLNILLLQIQLLVFTEQITDLVIDQNSQYDIISA